LAHRQDFEQRRLHVLRFEGCANETTILKQNVADHLHTTPENKEQQEGVDGALAQILRYEPTSLKK
jgi:hypothetical protein